MKKKTATNWQVIADIAQVNADDYLHESKQFAIKGFPEAAKGSYSNFREPKRAYRYAMRQWGWVERRR